MGDWWVNFKITLKWKEKDETAPSLTDKGSKTRQEAVQESNSFYQVPSASATKTSQRLFGKSTSGRRLIDGQSEVNDPQL